MKYKIKKVAIINEVSFTIEELEEVCNELREQISEKEKPKEKRGRPILTDAQKEYNKRIRKEEKNILVH